MIIHVMPDKEKAKSLLKTANITLQRLREIDNMKYPANTLTDHYDIIHKIMEAITALEGIKTKGDGAHQELIDYVCKNHNLGESTRVFLQELRDYRNRISYEGFAINTEYIKSNAERIETIISVLLNLASDKIK